MRVRKPSLRAVEFDWAQVKHNRGGRHHFSRRKAVTTLNRDFPPASIQEKPRMYSRGALAWTYSEDCLLITTLIQVGNVRWQDVAETMPGRTGVNCRDRWNKYLLKMAKYRHLIPDHVRNMRRRSKAEPAMAYESDDEDDLLATAAERAVADVFGDDGIFDELPVEVSIDDKFCFKDMLGLGAMPHVSKPVAPGLPLPALIDALPAFDQLLAHEKLSPSTCGETAPSSPGALAFPAAFNVRVVPRVNFAIGRGNTANAAGIVLNQFTKTGFAEINAMMRRPLARPVMKRVKHSAAKTPAIVFNTQLVRAMA
jgi:hypothetical protein